MTKKSKESATVILRPERAARLCRFITLLSEKSRSRKSLCRELQLHVRGFYRDYNLMVRFGIEVTCLDGIYTLKQPKKEALKLLPLPDPCLNMYEAIELSKGKSSAHQKLRKTLKKYLS